MDKQSSLEDFTFSDDALDGKEDKWNELISQIEKGNVIPVIGPDLLTELRNGQNYHLRLINKLSQWADVKSNPQNFSQLVYDGNFLSKLNKSHLNKDAIYRLLDQLGKVVESPHPLLQRLLGTKRFPFVITTSFTPVVENCMRSIWGDVRVLQFNNDSQRSMQIGFGDIQNEKEMGQPTVFYMFGKVSTEPHRYVVTDLDMMEFCRTWLTGMGVPRNLAECLRKRYLLFLGGSYSDWLFRFIWFSMRHSVNEIHKSSMFVVPNSSANSEDSFENFLERLETFTQHDPEYVIEQIEQRLIKLDAEKNATNHKDSAGTDVFLSYSRSDSDAASFLCEELQRRGVNVWFDRNMIGEAAKWRQVITTGIHQTKLFVPLLTNNISQEYLDPHEYRTEWEEAANISKRLGGRAFIIPVAEFGFDFYDSLTNLPPQFQELNATWYTCREELSHVADVIVQKLEELRNLKKGLK